MALGWSCHKTQDVVIQGSLLEAPEGHWIFRPRPWPISAIYRIYSVNQHAITRSLLRMLTYRVGLALLFPGTWRWTIILSPWVHSRPTWQWEDMTWSSCAYCITCFSPGSSNCWVKSKTSLIAQGFKQCFLIFIVYWFVRGRGLYLSTISTPRWRAIFQREIRNFMVVYEFDINVTTDAHLASL